MKPSAAQLDIVPGAALRGHRGDPDAEPSPFAPVEMRTTCRAPRDGHGRLLRTKEGRLLDPHTWEPSGDPAWLTCKRCSSWMPTTEPDAAAARFARWKGRAP